MKSHTSITLAAAAALGLASLTLTTSCGDEQFEGSITGAAIMTQTTDGQTLRVTEVKPGDHVTLTIGATPEHASRLEIQAISGIDYAPEVHYLIDGQEVGMSARYDKFFALNYTVALAPGQHTLSVDVPPIYHNIDYHIDVAPTTFTVMQPTGPVYQ